MMQKRLKTLLREMLKLQDKADSYKNRIFAFETNVQHD